MGLTFRPEVLACSAKRVSSGSLASLMGTLGWCTQFGSVGRPASALARHEPAAQDLHDGGETGSTKRAAADIRQTIDHFGAYAAGNPANVLCHGCLPPFLVLRPGRGGLLEREPDLKVVAIDDETNCSLVGLASYAIQEVAQARCLPLERLLPGVTLDDHWLVKEQLAVLGIVAPYPSTLGESCSAPKQSTQNRERLVDPVGLAEVGRGNPTANVARKRWANEVVAT